MDARERVEAIKGWIHGDPQYRARMGVIWEGAMRWLHKMFERFRPTRVESIVALSEEDAQRLFSEWVAADEQRNELLLAEYLRDALPQDDHRWVS